MPSQAEPIAPPEPGISPDASAQSERDPGYLVVCWNDPVNLMQYVTHVFRKVFGWDREKARRHMREVHEQGRSVLVREAYEQAEFHVHELQSYGLQATVEQDAPE